MTPAVWLWIPVTIWAAFAQTVRNAVQRGLTAEFAGSPLPLPGASFGAWVLSGAVAQIAATALLLRTMEERNFALGVAYSKSEVLQVAVFGLAFLGDPISLATGLAIAAGTAGVLLLSPAGWSAGFSSRTALLGIASGTGFAFSAVGYRGAALALEAGSGHTPFLISAAATLLAAQILQTLLLGGWLLARNPRTVARVLRAWRASLLAGFMGAAASAGWFTAFAIEPAAQVRTLGLVELVFSYAVSRKLFREKLSSRELAGMALLALGVVLISPKGAARGR